MWTQREAMHHENLTEFINPYNPNAQHMYSELAQMGMNEQQSAAYLAKTITDQGLILSANEIFGYQQDLYFTHGNCLVCQTAIWCRF